LWACALNLGGADSGVTISALEEPLIANHDEVSGSAAGHAVLDTAQKVLARVFAIEQISSFVFQTFPVVGSDRHTEYSPF
jgi:hypothetical protein